jgi:oligo-1,6-glucosidase
MVFTFEHMELDHGPGGRFDPKPFQLTELKATMSRWQDALFTTGWNALYLDNHDQPRLASRFGSDSFPRESAVALATVLHLHRGTPYVYQGEELGMTNPGFNTLDKWRDIESLNYAAAAFQAGVPDEAVLWSISEMGRDNARTPMQWDRGHQAGFTTGTPWIDVGPDYQAVNAEVERRDPGSVFHHYQKLIELRRRDRTVQLGDFTLLLAHHPRLHVFTRALDDDTLLVAANLSDEPDTLELGPSWDVGLGVVMATHPSPPTRANRVMLRPWEAIVARVLPSSLLPA